MLCIVALVLWGIYRRQHPVRCDGRILHLKSGSALLRACAPEPVRLGSNLTLLPDVRGWLPPLGRAFGAREGGPGRRRLGEPQEANPARPVRTNGTALGLSTDEWVGLAPRLRG